MAEDKRLEDILIKNGIKSVFDHQAYASLKSDLAELLRVVGNEREQEGIALESKRESEGL